MKYLIAIAICLIAFSCHRLKVDHIKNTPAVLSPDLSQLGSHIQISCLYDSISQDFYITKISLKQGRKFVSFLDKGIKVELIDSSQIRNDEFYSFLEQDGSFDILINNDVEFDFLRLKAQNKEIKTFKLPKRFSFPISDTIGTIVHFSPPYYPSNATISLPHLQD